MNKQEQLNFLHKIKEQLLSEITVLYVECSRQCNVESRINCHHKQRKTYLNNHLDNLIHVIDMWDYGYDLVHRIKIIETYYTDLLPGNYPADIYIDMFMSMTHKIMLLSIPNLPNDVMNIVSEYLFGDNWILYTKWRKQMDILIELHQQLLSNKK